MVTIGTDSSGSTTIVTTNSTSALFEFKKFIKSNGWTVTASSDGLSNYNPTQDVLTSASSGANGLGNPNAWFIITKGNSPSATGNAFCFQRGSSDNQFRVKYSAGGFVSDSGSGAIKVFSATDEQVLLGSGTDASPLFDSLFRTSGANLKCHFLCDVTYGSWAMFGNEPFQTTISFFHAFDYVQYANSSDDPYVTILDGKSSPLPGAVASLNGLNSKVKGYLGYGLTSSYFGDLQAFDPSADGASIMGNSGSYNMPSSPYTQKDGTLPVIYGKRSNASYPTGIKGQSSLLRWHLQNARPNYYGFAVSSAPGSTTVDYRIVIGNISLPWNNSSVSF